MSDPETIRRVKRIERILLLLAVCEIIPKNVGYDSELGELLNGIAEDSRANEVDVLTACVARGRAK